MQTQGLFSIVVPTLNEGDMLHMTVDSILEKTEYPNFELIIVDDGSTDESCDRYKCANGDPRIRLIASPGLGVAKARNLGASHARGEFIVFLDAHCKVSPNWLGRFSKALKSRDVGVVGPCFTRLNEPQPRGAGMNWFNDCLDLGWFEPVDTEHPYEVPITPGGCQAFRTKTFQEIGCFDQGFGRWGSEDVEVCLRAWLLGYRVLVDPTITIAHDFRDSRNFEVEDMDVTYNFLRLIHIHFSPKRIRRVLRAVGQIGNLDIAVDKLYQSDVFDIRAALERTRVRTDSWFCQTFVQILE